MNDRPTSEDLLAENARLRAQLEVITQERDAAVDALRDIEDEWFIRAIDEKGEGEEVDMVELPYRD